MKAVLLYEPGKNMDAIMAAFPRHKALLDTFAERGQLLGVGVFDGGRDGSMAVFKDRAAAEAFIAQDPFVLEGLVGKHSIKDWSDEMLG